MVRHGPSGTRPDRQPRRLAEIIEAQKLRDDVIADLRERLDRPEAERREAQARIVALLTDQRPAVPDSPRSAWRRFLAWRRR
jgi:hypothetical protein